MNVWICSKITKIFKNCVGNSFAPNQQLNHKQQQQQNNHLQHLRNAMMKMYNECIKFFNMYNDSEKFCNSSFVTSLILQRLQTTLPSSNQPKTKQPTTQQPTEQPTTQQPTEQPVYHSIMPTWNNLHSTAYCRQE